MFVLLLNEHFKEQKEGKMKLNSRQKKILDILTEKQRATVNYLSEALYYSKMTIRRDLEEMEKSGLLVRYHGGAMLTMDYLDYPIDMRMQIEKKEKQNVAALAEKHIKDGQVIFLPGSSTCSFLLPCLKKHENIHVITNSVGFMLYLSKVGIKCTLTGGEYSASQGVVKGRGCERFLRYVNSDIAFVTVDGISHDGVISVKDEENVELVRIGLENASKKILIAVSSKQGLKYTYNVGRTEDFDDIIII